MGEIGFESYEDLKRQFRRFLEGTSLGERTINTRSSDAFYLQRNSDIDFWALLKSEDFEELSTKYIKETLEKNSKGNNEKNLNGYKNHLRELKKFVDSIAGEESMRVATEKRKTKNNSVTKIKDTKNIPTPCKEQVELYLNKWGNLTNYSLQEKALEKMFNIMIPGNNDIVDILLKTATLNDFYSTNIFSIYDVAKHIEKLDIDERLKEGDLTLIDDIKAVDINGKRKNFYSFATKYCSHHNENEYPIYDSYVEKVLIHFRNRDKMISFKNNDLKDYIIFKEVVLSFREVYGLNDYSIKEIDKYIWLLGKEYFPKSY